MPPTTRETRACGPWDLVKIPDFEFCYSSSEYTASEEGEDSPDPVFQSVVNSPENPDVPEAMENQPPPGPQQGFPMQPGFPPQAQQVTLSVEELLRLVREGASAGAERKSAKGPDTGIFNAEGSKVAEDLDRFRTSLTLKFEAEADRYTTARRRVSYVFERLEGRASALCIVGIQEHRYVDWDDMIRELEVAFGELDPDYAWDKRLLNLRQGNRTFAEHINEFRTVAQRAGFGEGRGLISILRNSLVTLPGRDKARSLVERWYVL